MPMTDGSIRASVQVRVRGTFRPEGAGTALRNRPVEQFGNVALDTLGFGTDEGLCDTLCCLDYPVPAGQSLTLDLYTGTDLPDIDDADAPFRTVKFVEVAITSGGDSSGVRVGGAASDEWVGFFAAAGDKYDIFPGGPPFMGGDPVGNGKTVTASTKNLKVENLGAVAATVRVVVGGNKVVPGMWMGFGLWTYS